MKRLGIASKSEPDANLVTGLADRLLVQEVDWIEDEALGDYREWRGVCGTRWLDLHEAFRRARGEGLPVYGHFRGEPGALDASMHRAVLHLFATDAECPAVVVVARDLDGRDERRQGFQQAVAEREWPFAVVGALADPEIEAWLVAAWTPESDADRDALDAVRKRIGFDPCEHPERLTSKRATDRRGAKRVVEELCASGASARERWSTARIDARLVEAGRGCGLSGYIEGVRTQLVPVFKLMPLSLQPK